MRGRGEGGEGGEHGGAEGGAVGGFFDDGAGRRLGGGCLEAFRAVCKLEVRL